MPPVSKEQLKINKEFVELKKAETKATNDLLKANKENEKEYKKLKAAYTAATKAVNDYQKAIGKVVKEADDWSQGMADMTKKMAKGINQGKGFDKFLSRVAKTVSSSKNNFGEIAEEMGNMAKTMGSEALSGNKVFQSLKKVTKQSELILATASDRTKFADAELDTMIEQAQTMANTLDITEGISDAAKERVREDIKLLKTMKAQKQVMEKMVEAAKPFAGIAEGARDAFAQIKSNPHSNPV